jgi:hypothetical protein
MNSSAAAALMHGNSDDCRVNAVSTTDSALSGRDSDLITVFEVVPEGVEIQLADSFRETHMPKKKGGISK